MAENEESAATPEQQKAALLEHPDIAECSECGENEYMAKAKLDGQDVIICSSCQRYWPLDQAVDLIPEEDTD